MSLTFNSPPGVFAIMYKHQQVLSRAGSAYMTPKRLISIWQTGHIILFTIVIVICKGSCKNCWLTAVLQFSFGGSQ